MDGEREKRGGRREIGILLKHKSSPNALVPLIEGQID